eukprot:Cvel_9027.t1-p1 / transcript=Cvel_9027.t1 / gene=Cvel_9027 / organism=Chromera_velia_CCMP2878 / gene_product=Calcium/calmodulin-dependent protein kinase type 1G, putative / transcript_product=Calcium/calmodulin-dependent protein kinase type 1G, putative / location=Cvel_scaffold511:77408-83389(+) / protein_length=886 / sequence_SO=supercontig / SO=protein_coding / is_pseudo=false
MGNCSCTQCDRCTTGTREAGIEIRPHLEDAALSRGYETLREQHTQAFFAPSEVDKRPPRGYLKFKKSDQLSKEYALSFGGTTEGEKDREASLVGGSPVFIAVHRGTKEVRSVRAVRKPEHPEARERMAETVEKLLKLRHESIASVLDVFEDYRFFFLVMEKVSGETIVQRILSRRHFTEQQAAVVIFHVLHSLLSLHEMGIGLGGLCPESLMFQDERPQSLLKLVDFGLEHKGHFWDRHLTRGGSRPVLAPPEAVLSHHALFFQAPETVGEVSGSGCLLPTEGSIGKGGHPPGAQTSRACMPGGHCGDLDRRQRIEKSGGTAATTVAPDSRRGLTSNRHQMEHPEAWRGSMSLSFTSRSSYMGGETERHSGVLLSANNASALSSHTHNPQQMNKPNNPLESSLARFGDALLVHVDAPGAETVAALPRQVSIGVGDGLPSASDADAAAVGLPSLSTESVRAALAAQQKQKQQRAYASHAQAPRPPTLPPPVLCPVNPSRNPQAHTHIHAHGHAPTPNAFPFPSPSSNTGRTHEANRPSGHAANRPVVPRIRLDVGCQQHRLPSSDSSAPDRGGGGGGQSAVSSHRTEQTPLHRESGHPPSSFVSPAAPSGSSAAPPSLSHKEAEANREAKGIGLLTDGDEEDDEADSTGSLLDIAEESLAGVRCLEREALHGAPPPPSAGSSLVLLEGGREEGQQTQAEEEKSSKRHSRSLSLSQTISLPGSAPSAFAVSVGAGEGVGRSAPSSIPLSHTTTAASSSLSSSFARSHEEHLVTRRGGREREGSLLSPGPVDEGGEGEEQEEGGRGKEKRGTNSLLTKGGGRAVRGKEEWWSTKENIEGMDTFMKADAFSERISVKEALQHEWITSFAEDSPQGGMHMLYMKNLRVGGW